MKSVVIKNDVDILRKIESIEKEIMKLKLSVLKKLAPSGKKVISVKGILKGVNVTDEDIALAKKSLFNKAKI